jgi:cell division protein ZipA
MTGRDGNFSEDGQEFFISSSSESEARAVAALPAKGSEDASRILGDLELAPSTKDDRAEEYKPAEEIEWVVTIRFPGRPALDPKAVSALFDEKWRQQYGGFMAYGRDAAKERWTYLISADGPKAVTELMFAWDYDETASAVVFQRRLAAVRSTIAKLGHPAEVVASLPSEEAAERAGELQELKERLEGDAVLVLQAQAGKPGKPFNGKKMWDVLLSLGLKWGDMDCFHWDNKGEIGDEAHFSVHTSTEPGYFLPEEVAAGRMNPEDLIFSFSIPRSAAPLKVFDAMVRGAEYCQKRLGGEILDQDGEPADVAAIRSQIREIENELSSAGFIAGMDLALRLF